MSTKQKRFFLSENDIPSRWYNITADMKNKPAPLLNPETHKPMTAEELSGVFCDELIKQELDDTNPYYEIPQEITRREKLEKSGNK
mgnify:CR=1 FL=1